MKLYNKTKCPDAILRSILVAAGRSVGARTAKVVCKITQGRSLRSKGMAYSGFPYQWHLKRVKSKQARHRIIETDGGWIEIMLPQLYSIRHMKCFPSVDAITLASAFLKTAQHEWAHIKDFQHHTYRATPTTASGRRIRWAERPCEIYAIEQVEQAQKISDDKIMALALWLEETQPTV